MKGVGRVAQNAPMVLAFAFIALGVALPLSSLVIDAMTSPPKPSGFGQEPQVLLTLAYQTLVLSLAPAALATVTAMWCSTLSVFDKKFGRFYRRWMYTIMFTNPLFFVLGLTVLFANVPATLAVVLASWLVLMPFVGLPVQAAADQIESTELAAARALGGELMDLVRDHVFPSIGGAALVGLTLGFVFAAGFYLVPVFVGFGQVPTLATSVDSAFNRLGDAEAAAQLAVLLVGLEIMFVLVLAACFAVVKSHRMNGASS